VDAPCSGLGTVKRHPERLLSITPEQIADYPPLQLAILKRGSQLLKPSGTLVYSTCSIHPAENRAVVDAFLASPEGTGFVLESETLLPITPLHDGFYVAVMKLRF
jgi:16S rRNA (cytosine967-C5)-methyltransferase